MWVTDLLLAVAVAISPSQIAGVAYILSRREPGHLLRDYYLGGFGISLIAGVVIVFALGQLSASTSSSTLLPCVQIAVGALALVVALLVGTGVSERMKERREARRQGNHARGKGQATEGGPASAEKKRSHVKVPKRLQTALDGGSPWVAWVVGIGVGLPSPYYLAAIAAILHSGVGTGGRIAALLLFNIVAFATVEVALVGFRLVPDTTQTRLTETHQWADAHKQAIATVLAAVVGVYLIYKGIGQL